MTKKILGGTVELSLGTVTPYLKKIQKVYQSRDTPFEFC